MKDTDIMPWGAYGGKKMANVPAKYLLWLYDNNKASGGVLQYIKDNLENLRLEK
ncbi:MAG: hypothetical protein JWQ09_4402 [Segetibacter sp.]|nr:hypothetical protein [Segetibacter sp.]